MPNKRHARRHHRDATRLASTGEIRRAGAGMNRAAAEYRAHLEAHPDDQGARRELADLLTDLANARTTAGDNGGAATALTERLTRLTELDAPAPELARTGLDLAEAHLDAGHLLSAATRADDALRTFDRRTDPDPATPGFAELADALARNARILHRTADPDLAVGAADQATRMLLALPHLDQDRRGHLLATLTLATELHTAAGRDAHARSAARVLAHHFPGADPPTRPRAGAPLTLRGALTTAARIGALADTGLIDRLCPDPAAHGAPPAISARCDPGLAPVALHTVTTAVQTLRHSHNPLAWRIATEIHYLLNAADRQGERNLRLNFRDHGPAWMSMLLALAETTGPRADLASDLARVLAELLERLRSRHAADERGPHVAAATRFIAAHARERP